MSKIVALPAAGNSNTNPTVEFATTYTARGWRVIPVNSETREPTNPWDGHLMSNWPEAATTDRKMISWWWGNFPDYGVAIATGRGSGIIVIDVDTKKGKDGPADLAAAETRWGKLPPTLRQNTPSGGYQLLFAYPAALAEIGVGNAVGFAHRELGHDTNTTCGLDIRGDGGQVNVAPTVRGGRGYEWASDPATAQLGELPEGWFEALRIHAKPGAKKGKAAKPPAATPSQPGSIPSGVRNDTLFRQEAARLRGMDLGEEAILAHLLTVNRDRCDPPLSEDEVREIAASAMRYGANEWFELNDSGNAARFARDHVGRARYVSDADTWRVWNGRCWEADPGELGMLRLAAETVAGIKQDAEQVTKAEVKKTLMRHARNSGDHARLRAMIKVAASLPGMAAYSSEFDQLLGVIVAANGAIDLSTGALMPHDPARLSTKALPTAYRPDAEAPTFTAFLERVQPDPEVRTFLQRVLGQALHGQRAEQIMTWWHGRGRNGKSVLADTLISLLPGYAVETSASTFLADDKKDPNRPRSDLMRLRGSRLVLGAEAADRRRLDGQRLKQLTGDATLTARELQGRETAFPITFHIVVLTNPWPNVDEADDALWTRLVRVPFPVTIPAAEQIKNLHKKILATEAEGVLSWLVRGAVDYAQEGLMIPPVLIQATADWRRRIGTVERYMRAYIRRADGKRLQLRWLHSEYVKEEQKVYGNPVGEENFRARLEGLGYNIFDGELGEIVQDVETVPLAARVRAQGGTS